MEPAIDPTFGRTITVAGRPDGARPFAIASDIDSAGILRVRLDDPGRPDWWAEVRVDLAGLPWCRTTEADGGER